MKTKDQKRREAIERQTRWNSLSVAEKIQQLTDRGFGDSIEAEALHLLQLKEKNNA